VRLPELASILRGSWGQFDGFPSKHNGE